MQYAVAAAGMSLEMSGLKINDSNANRVGVFTGNGIGGLTSIEKTHKISLERGPRRITPFFIPMAIVLTIGLTIKETLSAGQNEFSTEQEFPKPLLRITGIMKMAC